MALRYADRGWETGGEGWVAKMEGRESEVMGRGREGLEEGEGRGEGERDSTVREREGNTRGEIQRKGGGREKEEDVGRRQTRTVQKFKRLSWKYKRKI